MTNKLVRCRICGSRSLHKTVDLGCQPWANDFLSADRVGVEKHYPLEIVNCTECRLAQLSVTVPKETMFSDHTYLSGMTGTLSAHFQSIASGFSDAYFKGHTKRRVLDIGSNDGSFLKHFQKLGWEVLGVESAAKPAAIAQENGINTIQAFYDEECQASIDGSFEIINASGVFFHLEELHSVTKAIKSGLSPDGVFIVQFLYMRQIIDNLAFDQIYHEHLLYYTLETLGCLLSQHGLEVFDAYVDPIHGGSVIASVCHPGIYQQTSRYQNLLHLERQSRCNEIESYINFQHRVRSFKVKELETIFQWKKDGRRIFGLGAPVKGNTLLNYLGLRNNSIEILVEKNSLRKGLFAPGSHIKVVLEDELSEIPDVYYVLAWNFKDEILRRYKNLLERGVIFHFPVNPSIA